MQICLTCFSFGHSTSGQKPCSACVSGDGAGAGGDGAGQDASLGSNVAIGGNVTVGSGSDDDSCNEELPGQTRWRWQQRQRRQ